MVMSASEFRNPAGRGIAAAGEALSNALCACIISYCVVSFFAGQAGLLAYGDLKSGIARMNDRIEALSSENRVLQDARNSLATDSDRMAREARDIGYIRPGEKIVVFSSQAPKEVSDQVHDIEPVQTGFSTGLPDRMIKILAAMTGATVLFISFLMSMIPKRRTSARMQASRS